MNNNFKSTELGDIPVDWELTKLIDFTDEITDYVAAGSFESLRNNVKVYDQENFAVYVRLTDLRKGLSHGEQKYVDEASYNFLRKSNLFGDEILIANIGANVGEVFLMPFVYKHATIAPNMILIRANNHKVNPHYLYSYLASSVGKLQINKIISGSGQPKLNKTELRQLLTVLPPLSEQKKIAEILTTIDHKIELIDAQLLQSKTLKIGLTQQLLIIGIGHKEFKQSHLGMIPKEWELREADNLGISFIDGDRGTNYPKEKDFSRMGYCLFLSAKNVTKNGFKFTDCQFISKEKDAQLRNGKLVRNDIVLTTRGSVGNIALYNTSIDFEHIRLNSGMVIIRDTNQIFLVDFLYQFLKSKIFQSQIDNISFGSAQPQLTIKELKKVKILIPPFEEQKKIAEILNIIDEKEQILNAKKKIYQDLKIGLMQQLLTGKIRVNTYQQQSAVA